ncbi:MAG: RNA polymerase sigma factor region1.1 domain-containing protein [Thermacetogeniaceae bacterium]
MALVKQGQGNNGFVTYDMIIDVLNKTSLDFSLEDVDYIYGQLASHGIEIVDKLPEKLAPQIPPKRIKVKKKHPESGSSYRRRAGLSTIDAVDELLCVAEEVGLCRETFFAVVRRYHLTSLEVFQLAELLWARGVEIQGLHPSDLCNIYSIKNNVVFIRDVCKYCWEFCWKKLHVNKIEHNSLGRCFRI